MSQSRRSHAYHCNRGDHKAYSLSGCAILRLLTTVMRALVDRVSSEPKEKPRSNDLLRPKRGDTNDNAVKSFARV